MSHEQENVGKAVSFYVFSFSLSTRVRIVELCRLFLALDGALCSLDTDSIDYSYAVTVSYKHVKALGTWHAQNTKRQTTQSQKHGINHHIPCQVSRDRIFY